MSEIEFVAWPSTPRLHREMTITEKLDGTNACIVVGEDTAQFACQSRKRLITPESDNHGFAAWVYENWAELTTFLGPGRHYGEWWGHKIGRGYGLTERRFSLFNVKRWAGLENWDGRPKGLDVVPTLYKGEFSTEKVSQIMSLLKLHGSYAAPGFDDPEGVIVWHDAAQQKFKSTFDACDAYGGGGKTWEGMDHEWAR